MFIISISIFLSAIYLIWTDNSTDNLERVLAQVILLMAAAINCVAQWALSDILSVTMTIS
ncbi:hypothetical protein VPFG_00224 [Vibrio phage nt-1]|uniref:Uncharacterized protein n=1 Tax=Vibrio phage nt-1 TaxID=115992 RepID=R9TFH4_9CAUD|nr:hypothetical protein VPFG_00224 [Vibrio phage nt-1]AGN30224.1 hypothetical protein VPFG_00224 [Vibrio phage nt-1]